jgi:hypothetical protein
MLVDICYYHDLQDSNEYAKGQKPSAIRHFVTHLPNQVIGRSQAAIVKEEK